MAEPEEAPQGQIVRLQPDQFSFWEFGRFAVEYRAVFGEPPSMSLRLLLADRPPFRDRPSAQAA